MIIFDLDGTLANCDHRISFVDPTKSVNHLLQGYDGNGKMIEEAGVYCNIIDGKRFKPKWKSFYEACDKDDPIDSTIEIIRRLRYSNWEVYAYEVNIWSGRCESVREKTENWLRENEIFYNKLKMRPIKDNTPDDVLKERWLDEAIKEGKTIDFVFDDRPKVIRMWRRRGIFVFNCCQHDEEF